MNEDLFGDEYNKYVDYVINEIWDTTTWKMKNTVPTNFTSLAASRKTKPNIVSLPEARSIVRKSDDAKYHFWKHIKNNQIEMSKTCVKCLKKLLSEQAEPGTY